MVEYITEEEKTYEESIRSIYMGVLKGEAKFPRGFWQNGNSKKNARICIRYLIEEVLELNEEELKKQLELNLFRRNGLGSMANSLFGNSPYKCIIWAYPERNYKQWEFGIVPKGFWKDIENANKAVRWLIEDKLKWSEDEIPSKLQWDIFKKNGLGGMLNSAFENSHYKAIASAYPERNYKTWQFNVTTNNYWDSEEKGIEAVRWLINEKLKLNDEEIKKQVSVNFFRSNGLGGMLSNCFSSSPYKAISKAFPEKNLKAWEFNHAPIGYWADIDNVNEAIRWLAEEKLNIDRYNPTKKVRKSDFKAYGLKNMLDRCFGGSPKKAIKSAYPELSIE